MRESERLTIARLFATATIALTLCSAGWAQSVEKILYAFSGSDGSVPQVGITLDAEGNLYGTTSYGGSLGCCGTVFELSPSSNGTWAEKVIYDFSIGAGADGSIPWGGLVFDGKGNLYGTAFSGGAYYQGAVFELTPGSDGTWTEKVLYSFTGGADGGALLASTLIVDGSGNLYGTGEVGGAYGLGVVFEIVASANGTWTEKVLHSFAGNNDGASPYGSPLVMNAAGKLYGATPAGGAHDYGVVYELTPQSNGTWSEKIIYALTGLDGLTNPFGGLVLDTAGNLYSAFALGILELIPGKNGIWTEKTLYRFVGSPDGAGPDGVVSSKAGNLYGTTNTGGVHRGTVFQLSPGSNGSWSERILHRFQPDGIDGIFPQFGTLAIDSSGNLYGTTPQGGSSSQGVVFEVTP